MTTDLGPLARELSLPYYDAALPAHDRFHARRVRDVALRLADESDHEIDRDVLAAAAWLHDIGRPLERTGDIDDHDAWGATEAVDLLASEGVPTATVDAVEHCIRAHSIRASSPEPATDEAKLLFDADKLDAAGARGIVRLACIVGERSGQNGEPHAVIDDASGSETASADSPDISLLRHWTRERLDALYTDPGRRLGAERWGFVQEFFERFEREAGVDGTR